MTAPEILASFRTLKALVVGDICLDRWCRYEPSLDEASRETGIPRVAVLSTEVTPGAGGTVANNLAALGAGKVAVLGWIGDDGFGFELERALASRGIKSELLTRRDAATFTYTKLINSATGEEDVPRIDYVNAADAPEWVDREIAERMEKLVPEFDVIVISDQAETDQGGVVTPLIRSALARLAAEHPQTVFWADSRLRAERFRRTILKVNESEAKGASVRALGCVDFAALREYVEAPFLAVTAGPEGVQVVDAAGSEWVRTRGVEKPVDICGAGDAFSACAALALRVTGDPLAAARFGNLAASVTIMKKGTGTASAPEILERLEQS